MDSLTPLRINIGIDDVSPHPRSSVSVIDTCNKVIADISNHCDIAVKFTFFVPTAYWRTVRVGTMTDEPLLISHYSAFCDVLSKLDRASYEVAYHGHYHGIPWVSDNDELRSVDYVSACRAYDAMLDEAARAGLHDTFRMIIRPPAWRMSAAAIDAAIDYGFSLSLLDRDYAIQSYAGHDFTHDADRVLYCNVTPPHDDINVCSRLRTAIIMYHACDWDAGFFHGNNVHALVDFILNNAQRISFKHQHELLDEQTLGAR